MPLQDILTPRVRQYLYVASFLIGLGIAAAQSGFIAAGVDAPQWFTVAIAVYGVVAAGLGITAASNVTRRDEVVAVVEEDEFMD